MFILAEISSPLLQTNMWQKHLREAASLSPDVDAIQNGLATLMLVMWAGCPAWLHTFNISVRMTVTKKEAQSIAIRV